MPRDVRTYRCLIISPSDVDAERDGVEKALRDWNAHAGPALGVRVEAVRWESHARPELGGPPQTIINRHLAVDDCDFGIAIFWSRVGSPTAAHASGSVEEIERLRARSRQVMVYFCERDIPQAQLRDDQFRRLQQLRNTYMAQGLLGSFRSVEELYGMISHKVTGLVQQLQAAAVGAGAAVVDTAPKPDVRVRPIYVGVRGRPDPIIEIRVENLSRVAVFLQSLELFTYDFDVLVCNRDCVTGKRSRRVV